MNDNSSKREQALEACEKVINGIEDGTISISSSLLLCKKIARLVNDLEGQEWLSYEDGGYPRGADGRILSEARKIAVKHGRSYQTEDDKGRRFTTVFVELSSELEAIVCSDTKALNNYTTQGYSVSGDQAVLATSKMASSVAIATNGLLRTIKTAERRLSILKAQYYNYAIKWQIELQFGTIAKSVFEEYQERVDRHYASLPEKAIRKLNAIMDLMDDSNPERYSQVLTSCRRLWSETANILFDEVLPGYSDKIYKTKSGKEIDVSGDHDLNKLSAVIETLQSKAAPNTLVGSETLYVVDWIKQVSDLQNAGVHSEVTKEQAMQCIIHTYIALGDILSLKAAAID